MKHLLSLLLLLALFLLNSHADTEPNGTCLESELITELNSIAATTTRTETGSVDKDTDLYDYYYFSPGKDGNITLSYSSTDSTDFIVSTASCGNSEKMNLNNATSGGPVTFTVTSSDTVYLRVFGQKTANYSINITFTLDVPGPKNFTCANPKTFTSVFNQNTSGNILMIGNTSLCADDDNDGVCEDPGTATNNNILMKNNDVDGNATTTLNSSAATLTMPADAEVLYASLTWQGYLVNANQARKDSAATIKFAFDGTPYNTTTVNTSNFNWVYFDATRFYYQGTVDITSYIQDKGSGKYWVGDIVSDTGAGIPGGGFGGWAITVVYKSDTEVFRNLSVYSGYEAIAGNTDIANALTYANNNGCSTTTGVGNNVSTTVSGFLTPKQAPVSSRLTVFAGEGDVGLSGDTISLTNKAGTAISLSNAANTSSNVMNSSISVDGTIVTSGDPYYSANSLGIDVDQYNTSSIMDTEQTSTTITLTTSGDGYFPAIYAFSAQLYEPQMCYDYAYSQNNRFFTEENNGTAAPRIVGNIQEGVDVNLTVMIRNNELSDFNATNVKLSIRDLNTSQASYLNNSTAIIKANKIFTESAVVENSGPSFIRGIDEGNIPGRSATYNYITLTNITAIPSTSDINLSLDANISYELLLPDGAGGFYPPIHYDSDLGSDKVPLCPGAGSVYTPTWGVFNVEDSNLYASSPGKYNLYTQVVNRPFTFDVVSYDPSNLTVETNTTMFVGVDLVDISRSQTTEGACSDPERSISPTIRLHFTGGATRITADLNQAVTDGYLTSVSEFFGEAREEVAFRVSYLVKPDGSGDPIAFTDLGGGVYKMDGFTSVAGQPCAIDPRTGAAKIVQKANGQPTSLAPVACGNAGTTGVSAFVLDQCLQCITETNVKYVCSRDNFSIRPEALMVDIYDNNQSANAADPTLQLPYESDISAGYNYRYDVTATTHTDENPSAGYTQGYSSASVDHYATYYWRPEIGKITTGCNDTQDKQISIYVANGEAVNNLNRATNVGRYELEMRDTAWTKADQSPTHHTSGAYAAYFNTNDCTLNESFVPASAAVLTSANIGCNISSNHENVDRPSVVYSDYNITVHPYDFNLSAVTFNKGRNFTLVGVNDYVYFNDISIPNDANMSVRYSGNIKAVSAQMAAPLSNFVADCYAENIDLDLNTSNLPATPLFRYRLIERNATAAMNNNKISDINGTNVGLALLPSVTIPASRFTKALSGESRMEFNFNFDRNITGAINPITLVYDQLGVSCTTPANCRSYANFTSTHLPDTNLTSDLNVTHIYGRLHTPRQRVADTDPSTLPATAVIPLYYEFYCNSITGCNINDYTVTPALAPDRLLSQDDVRWYVQDLHDVVTDGNATITQTRGGLNNARFNNGADMNIDPTARTATYIYDGSQGYPYKATIELSTQDWLLYNRYDITATQNEFELEFTTTGQWSGKDQSQMGLDANSSTNVNRRVEW